MLIINGGMPRAGTVLVGNLVRLMLERRGILWQRFNPQERRHLPQFLDLTLRRFDHAVIVHTHPIDGDVVSALRARDDAVLIWNHRDPRDALVSLMQLHDMSLEHGLKAMQVYGAATEIAHTSHDCLKFTYEALIKDVPEHIALLAQAMGFRLEDGEVDALVEQTSTTAHSRIMSGLQTGAQTDGRELQTMRRVLREDPTTLVNDRHIQSGKSNRWQRELPADAQRQATRALSRWIRLFSAMVRWVTLSTNTTTPSSLCSISGKMVISK